MSKDQFLSEEFKEKLRQLYEDSKRFYEKLVDEVLYIIENAIEREKIKIHSIASRETKIKTFRSFYGKIKRKEIRKNQFKAIQDIAAVRVTCLYRSDLEKIGDIILKNFNVKSADTRRTRTTTPFGYMSDQYVVELPGRCRGARYDDIKRLPCEIQVRTILMHAWASVSHHVAYKQEVDIPLELRTDFNALAGMFYVADTHFELFKAGAEEARANLLKTVREGVFDLDQEVNLDSVLAYGKWKFSDREEEADSRLISDLITHGYKTLRQVDEKVRTVPKIIKAFEKELITEELAKPFTTAGLIWACLDLTDSKFFDDRAKKHNWSKRLLATIEKYRAKIQE